jgi:putative flippase GtrA
MWYTVTRRNAGGGAGKGGGFVKDFLRRFLSHDCDPFAQFVKYGAIGAASTVVQFAVFYFLASTCLKCLTPDDKAVELLGLPSVVFSGDEPWHAARWFLADVATAVGFSVANVFCWLMNRAFVFRPGKFRWYVEFGMFFGVAATATAIAIGVQTVLIRYAGTTTSAAAVVQALVAFMMNFFARKFFIFRG